MEEQEDTAYWRYAAALSMDKIAEKVLDQEAVSENMEIRKENGISLDEDTVKTTTFFKCRLPIDPIVTDHFIHIA